MSRFTAFDRRVRVAAFSLLLLLLAPTGGAQADTTKETVRLAYLISQDFKQQRAYMVEDATLADVAQSRAEDMAARGYFSHTNPDGNGANTLLRSAGYVLPSNYDQSADGNNVESIAAGQTNPKAAFDALVQSPSHRPHILGEDPYFREQTCYGIGHVYSPGSVYGHYWVVLTAPRNGASGAIGTGTQLVGPFSGASSVGGGWYRNDTLGRFQLSGDGRSAWIENLDETVSYDGYSWTLRSDNYGTLTPWGNQNFYSLSAGLIETGDYGGWVWNARVGNLIAVGGGWFWVDSLGSFLRGGDDRFF